MAELTLYAGPLRMLYQNGFIRYVSYGDEELLRMIYFAFRDGNWGTLPLHLENEKIEAREDSFRIAYDAFHTSEGEPVCGWKVLIAGNREGDIEFEIQGEALKDTRKNRVGFCILHPHSDAARACETHHPDGSRVMHSFPGFVSPTDPFKNLSGMKWPYSKGWLTLRFHGDVFETEDQRNWSDASFKTFCTPLSKPFPVLLKKGENIVQKVSFALDKLAPIARPSGSITLHSSSIKTTLPAIGVGASSEFDDLSEHGGRLLRELPFTHYRVEVRTEKEDWKDRLALDVEMASRLHLPLAVALHLGEDFKHAAKEVLQFIKPLVVEVKRWILFSNNKLTTAQELIDFSGVIRTPGAKVGAGTNYNFTQLNRNRFDARPLDFVTFAVNPQEHAIDELTIIENMEGQNATIRSAKNIYPGKEILISPLTLKRRFNPSATESGARTISNEKRADSRQSGNFTAVFTIGSLLQQALAGGTEVTLFETIGKQGLLTNEGEPYPVFHALNLFSNCNQITPLISSHPLQCGGAILEGESEKRILLVNYTRNEKELTFENQEYTIGPYQWIVTSPPRPSP